MICRAPPGSSRFLLLLLRGAAHTSDEPAPPHRDVTRLLPVHRYHAIAPVSGRSMRLREMVTARDRIRGGVIEKPVVPALAFPRDFPCRVLSLFRGGEMAYISVDRLIQQPVLDPSHVSIA
jgi:hypothetical protein